MLILKSLVTVWIALLCYGIYDEYRFIAHEKWEWLRPTILIGTIAFVVVLMWLGK